MVLLKEDSAHGKHDALAELKRASANGLSLKSNVIPAEEPLVPGTPEYFRHLPVQDIHKDDDNTKDAWVPRHPDLVRLTGRHPFNCEPIPTRLFEAFITPPSLHYVRNHGAVPQIKWEEHRVVVNGLVSNPVSLTMADILAIPSIDVTCTLTCVGNRRKEQNMVKQTIGFNWGAAGTGCSTWTGVRLRDVLQAAGVKSPEEGARHVCFRGPKGELPKGDDGSYGTSLTLWKAMDPSADVILAYKQNGRLLTPDHGFPIRIIIPGYIGGRMVKWLEEITVTSEESTNHYHYFDNRVLPSHVDEKKALDEGWFYKPEYICNDLAVNSAIGYPMHDEVIPLTKETHTVRGYAYSGCGNQIVRCEVSLDDGKTWQLADITHKVEPNSYGKYWSWVWWQVEVPMADLMRSPEICCRAFDSAMNTQPNTFTWNVMGMMNNCVYRVKVHPQAISGGGFGLRFEHPTVAGPTVGGWMNRAAGNQLPDQQAKAATPAVQPQSNGRTFTMEEVEKHDSKDSAWFVVDGRVYDATPYLKDHPGGADSILLVAGTDATEEFQAIHSAKAKAMLLEYYIGDLEGGAESASHPSPPPTPAAAAAVTANGHSRVASASEMSNLNAALANGHTKETAVVNNNLGSTPPAAAAAPPTGAAVSGELLALNPKKKLAFKLVEKEELSHNTRRFRFALPSAQHRFGLPVGKHVFLYARINGELVMRAYTPSSSDDALGYFELVVKIYRANEHPRFPEGGKMSQHLDSLALGDTIDVKGPTGHVHYTGQGCYTLDGEPHHTTHISMIAGGTGITPMYQVIKAVLKDAKDTTQLSLLYANVSPDDILLREELDNLAERHPNFRVWYTVDRAPDDWQYSTGFICEEIIRERLFPAGENTVCFMCGPPPMIKFACLPNLGKLGYLDEQCIQF